MNNETRASTAYYKIKEDILIGKLKPGDKLRLETLKAEYIVGNSPLREALNRLLSNGMVTREENKGFSVSEISSNELTDIIKTRCWFEEIALRESIKNANDDYDEKIVLTVHRFTRADKNDTSSYERLRKDFHSSILSECNSNLLTFHCQQLYEQTLRYQNLLTDFNYEVEIQSCKNILEAILSRNEEEAVGILLSNYKKLNKKLISNLNLK